MSIKNQEDHLREECGVFGIYAPGRDVARMTCFGLQALQHRGQESAGIATGDGTTVRVRKDLGLVTQVFREDELRLLQGNVAIGHCRYSTSGSHSTWEAAQPHLSSIDDEIIALAHNGTLTNTGKLRVWLLEQGISFRSDTDSEVAAKLIGYFTRESHHMREGIRRTMELIEGAYAMTLVTKDALYVFRDPNGIRPLVLGVMGDGKGYVAASETCALDIVGARYLRDVAPGEVVRVNGEGFVAETALPPSRPAPCIFEHVYFARPDSQLDGSVVYEDRVRMGEMLAHEAPVDADIVIGVPDSGVPGAMGYAHESDIPHAQGIIKNRYVGRTFIEPTQELRQRGIRIKLNPLPSVVAGKRVIAVDDSIVRGNTSNQLVDMLREAGATEVHLRIISPPIAWPCFYGIDTGTASQLIAAHMDAEQIRSYLRADSLSFISLEGLIRACAGCSSWCTACFDGRYPVRIPDELSEKSFLAGRPPVENGCERGRQLSLFGIGAKL